MSDYFPWFVTVGYVTFDIKQLSDVVDTGWSMEISLQNGRVYDFSVLQYNAAKHHVQGYFSVLRGETTMQKVIESVPTA